MALMLDGTAPMPSFGGGSAGAGLGLGAGILGGGIGGLILGSLFNRNGGNGLFGGGGEGNGNGVAYDALQSQIQTLQGQVGANAIKSEIGELGEQVNNYSANTERSIGNVATAQAAANFTTLNSINGLGRDLVTNIHQQDLQQLNSFNNLTTTTLQGFNNSAMQIQNSTNQIIAQGTASAAATATGFCDIEKQMAACCCDIKQLISSDGNATRALINDLNVQNLRDQLAAANNKVSNNEQNQYLLSTILAHYPPITPVV